MWGVLHKILKTFIWGALYETLMLLLCGFTKVRNVHLDVYVLLKGITIV